MYDRHSREQKAQRIIKTLEHFFGKENLRKLTLLDAGSSTGIIDNILANYFRRVIGVDIDKRAVWFAEKKFRKKNLEFRVEDVMSLSFANNSFDVVICAQVYEHVPNANRLFSEIYRVLKPQGVCYFAALNRLWPMEPHYYLPFLSWLPKPIANFYVKILRGVDKYYETPKTYWELKKLTKNFDRIDYTQKILQNPQLFGYDDILKPHSFFAYAAWFIAPIARFTVPTFFWLLVKRDAGRGSL